MSFLCKNFLLGDAAQSQGSTQEVLCSIPSTMRKQDVAFRKYLMAEVTSEAVNSFRATSQTDFSLTILFSARNCFPLEECPLWGQLAPEHLMWCPAQAGLQSAWKNSHHLSYNSEKQGLILHQIVIQYFCADPSACSRESKAYQVEEGVSLVTGSTSSCYTLSLKLKYFVDHVYIRVCVCLLNYALRT